MKLSKKILIVSIITLFIILGFKWGGYKYYRIQEKKAYVKGEIIDTGFYKDVDEVGLENFLKYFILNDDTFTFKATDTVTNGDVYGIILFTKYNIKVPKKIIDWSDIEIRDSNNRYIKIENEFNKIKQGGN